MSGTGLGGPEAGVVEKLFEAGGGGQGHVAPFRASQHSAI